MTNSVEQPFCSSGRAKVVAPYDRRIGVTGHRDLPAETIRTIDTAVEFRKVQSEAQP